MRLAPALSHLLMPVGLLPISVARGSIAASARLYRIASHDHLRLSGAILVAAVLALFPVAANTGNVTLSSNEQALFSEINKARAEHGLDRVTLRDDLIDSARFHSHDMVERGYFEHGAFWRRLARFGIKYGTLGEVLGWDAHVGIAPRHLVELWLRSLEHRVVLLNPKYHYVGVGVANGPFRGFPNVIVVTADFWGP